MSVGSPTAGTWSSSQWQPDNEFETDRDGVLGTSIREAVCRMLEGGKDAFRQREHRYGQALDA